eukprot:5266026-Amphidinium_carterae.1
MNRGGMVLFLFPPKALHHKANISRRDRQQQQKCYITRQSTRHMHGPFRTLMCNFPELDVAQCVMLLTMMIAQNARWTFRRHTDDDADDDDDDDDDDEEEEDEAFPDMAFEDAQA